MRSPGNHVVTNPTSDTNEIGIQDNTDISEICFEKYISEGFVDKKDINHQDVSKILKQIRIKNLNNIIIGHLNVNSLVPKLDAIKTIIPGNIDIMIFSETKLDVSYPTAQLMIEGFKKPFRLDRDYSNGGGILIYIRSDIPSTLKSSHLFPEEIEGMFIEINLRKSKWLLFGTYHPPSQDDNYYFSAIGRALDIYTSKYDKIILAGDFNAEEKEKIFKNFLELYNLKSLVKDKTCFKSLQNPSCVDLFLTNCNRSFQYTKAISTGCSDCHKMVVTVLKTTYKKAKPKEIVYRSLKNFDKDIFREQLRRKLEKCDNYSLFEKYFLETYNEHAPIKKKVVRANEVPYMTKALKKAIATRSRLENRYYREKTDDSKTAYTKQRNYCSRLYKKERKKFYANLDKKHITDNKLFWRTMKPFFSDKGVENGGITLVDNDVIISDDQKAAETLNNFFSDAVPSLNVSIPSEVTTDTTVVNDTIETIILKFSNHPSILSINKNVKKGIFSFIGTDMEGIAVELKSLDEKKACMSSSIPPKVLKENGCVCAEPLKSIINSGISNGNFDDSLKRADLIPLHKLDDTTNKKNYRGISLLPVVSKIFEKIIQKQIGAYMDLFLSPFLCGYRKGFNAQHALLSMLEKWRISLDKGGYGGAVLMDLSKAFDTINHELLIAKLHAYGFDRDALKLIKSYLSNRWQRTKINLSFSSWSELTTGVPQGSVLGPLLFNIFINDLFFIVQDTNICNYADDNTLHTSDIRIDELMEKLEFAVEKALDWFEHNGMKLNSGKCHLLVCGHKYESMICKIGTAQVIEEHSVKLLGISIDAELTFESHLKSICKKASAKLNALSRLCTILPFYRRKLLMNAFFDSQFSHCPLVWMFHSRSINTKINNLHYRALRMIYQDDTASFNELLIKDGSVTIHQKNLQSLAIELFKVANGIAPSIMNDILSINKNLGTENVSASTRSQSLFYNPVNPKNVNNGLQTLRCIGPKIWNIVPDDIKSATSIPIFKNRIRQWKPSKCPCRLCLEYIPNLGFI